MQRRIFIDVAEVLGRHEGWKRGADDEGKVGHDEFYGHGFVNAARACGIN